MTLRLPDAVEETIRTHASETYPEECCGVLIGTEDRSAGEGPDEVRINVHEARRIENSLDGERERRYIIDPLALLEIEDALDAQDDGRRIVGIYHSHPDHPARPSRFDQDHALPGWSYVIVASTADGTGALGSFRLSHDRKGFPSEPVEQPTAAAPGPASPSSSESTP